MRETHQEPPVRYLSGASRCHGQTSAGYVDVQRAQTMDLLRLSQSAPRRARFTRSQMVCTSKAASLSATQTERLDFWIRKPVPTRPYLVHWRGAEPGPEPSFRQATVKELCCFGEDCRRQINATSLSGDMPFGSVGTQTYSQ